MSLNITCLFISYPSTVPGLGYGTGGAGGQFVPFPPPISVTPADRTFIISGIQQVQIAPGIVMLPTSEDIVYGATAPYVVGSSQFYTVGEVHWGGVERVKNTDWQLVPRLTHEVELLNPPPINTVITLVYYRWDIGARAGFKVNSYPVPFGFAGTTIIAEDVPPMNEFFTVEYTVTRPGNNPRSMFAIFPTMIDDILPEHTLYDTPIGFETYRPSGYKVYEEIGNIVWTWNGTSWGLTGPLASDTYFYVKRTRQVIHWDGVTTHVVYTAGDGSSSIAQVLQGPSRPYPLYGESIGKNFIMDAFSPNAQVDFPAAYEVSISPGDYDPWVPGI